MPKQTPSGTSTQSTTATSGAPPDLGVFIGRFQPFHLGHLSAIRQGLTKVRFLVVLVGSSNRPRTYFNPWTFFEREEMILGSLTEEERSRVLCLPLADTTYNDTKWVSQVRELAAEARESFGLPADRTRVGLVGHRKDGTSFYLNMFPQWVQVDVEDDTGLSATPMRTQYFTDAARNNPAYTDDVTPGVHQLLRSFHGSSDWAVLKHEYEFIEAYKAPYKALPYPPLFITVDACVIQSGHVLLVRRRSAPGKGLWALPGGHLEQTVRIEDWILEELEQETKIKIPKPVLRSKMRYVKVFDDPHRSARGRSVTHCGLIVLDTPRSKSGERVELPKVRGADDADKARWFPLTGDGAMDPRQMFEDHADIIADLTADL